MKFSLAMVLFTLLLTIPSPVFALDETFSKEQLDEDLETLWEAMAEHPKLYEYTSEAAFESLRKSISAQLKDGMTADDFLRIAHPLPVSIGCNHSILWPSMDNLSAPAGTTLPLTISFQEKGSFVVATYPADQIPRGSRIESINDVSMEEIQKKLFAYFPADGLKNMGIKRNRAGTMLPVLYPKLIEEADSYLIAYTAPGSDRSTSAPLNAFDKKTIWDSVMTKLKQDPYTVEYREELNTAIVKIKTFYFNNDNHAYISFLDDVFEKIKKDGIENLILDLRNNGGGDPMLAARLFSFIAHEPEVYFEVCDGYAPLLEPVELAEDHFNGNIFTLINGGGFSTAGHIVALIKYHGIGTIIGSELGCTYTCNDSAVSVVLKNTGNTVRAARAIYAVAVEGMDADRGVLPDHHVAFSATDLANGMDSEMEFTFDLIRDAR